MTQSNDCILEIRIKNRIQSSNSNAYTEKEIIDFAQNLMSLAFESNEFARTFSEFKEIFSNMQISDIEKLKSIHFDQFLINVLMNCHEPAVLQQCLDYIDQWISSCELKSSLFTTPDFTNLIISFIMSLSADHHAMYQLGYSIIKHICNQSDICINTIIESDFIQKSIDFYQRIKSTNPDDALQKEILNMLYFIVKSGQIPPEIAMNLIDIVSDYQFDPLNSNLYDTLLLASAYVECDENYCFFLIERIPLDSFNVNFDTLSDLEQAAFFRLLISIFDYADKPSLSVIADQFRWDTILAFDDRPENEIVKQYFAYFLCSAFTKCDQMIIAAFEANVFQLLFAWSENSTYSLCNASAKAMLRALTYLIEPIGLELLNAGILNIIIKQIDSNSKTLFKEICRAISVLNNYAETNDKKDLCALLNDILFVNILRSAGEDEEISSDDMEILKEAIQSIQDNQLWR